MGDAITNYSLPQQLTFPAGSRSPRTNSAGRAIRAEGGRCAASCGRCWRSLSPRRRKERSSTMSCNKFFSFFFFFLLSVSFFLRRFSEKLVLNVQVTDFASFKPGGAGSGSHALSVFGIPGYTTAGNFRRKAIKCFLNCRHRLKCPAVSGGPFVIS